MNHYTTLSLRPPPHPSSPGTIKRAYHAALLVHHPDKNTSESIESDCPSIDTIKLAYDILSNPTKRAEYDRQLLLDRQQSSLSQAQEHVLGNEIIDLDEMTLLEDGKSWQRTCRCGDSTGFVVHESELEDAASSEAHEVLVGCGGCSLSLRIMFGVANDNE